jgi:osmotically-inducible protein OsmY
MKIFLSLIFCFLLNSCALNVSISEEEIILNVKRALAEDEDVSKFAISVTKEDGRVVLSGTVDTDVQKQIATQVTYEVEGVLEVENHLFVKNPLGGKSY